MIRTPWVLALLSVSLASALPASAQDLAVSEARLNISAVGEVRAVPDMAQITVAVETTGLTAAQAMANNRERMAKVLAALAKQGLEPRDIQTTGLNLNPQYLYEANLPPKLTGYQAANAVTIVVNELGRLGATVDAVVSAGVNQVNGIGFGLKNAKALEDVARRAAVKALTDKAGLYAQAAGLGVPRLISLSEGVDVAPQPRPMGLTIAKMNAVSSTTPIAEGELKVRIDVSGIYALSR